MSLDVLIGGLIAMVVLSITLPLYHLATHTYSNLLYGVVDGKTIWVSIGGMLPIAAVVNVIYSGIFLATLVLFRANSKAGTTHLKVIAGSTVFSLLWVVLIDNRGVVFKPPVAILVLVPLSAIVFVVFIGKVFKSDKM